MEKDPVSFFLRRFIHDPATNKLLILIFSIILIISSSDNIRRRDWNLIPLIVNFSASTLYSALSLIIVVFKKQESVANCGVLKKFFRGRTVYFHEIQTTCSVALGIANISGIVLLDSTSEPFIQVLFSSVNIFLFSLEWYLAADKGKPFVSEENPKLGHNSLDCIFGGFHTFPLFFNVIRKGCLIAALVLVVTNPTFGYPVTYFIYCTSFALAGSFMLFVLQTSGSLENGISTKLVSGRKWHTYLMLIVLIHAFLAVLTFSIVVDSRVIDRPYRQNYDNSNYYNRNGYYNRGRYGRAIFESSSSTEIPVYRRNYNYSNYYNNDNDYYNRYYNRGRYNTRTPLNETTWYTQHYTEWVNAPLESPIAFGLSCIVLLLSAMDLYARAIYSRSRRDAEITSPLHIQGGVNKVEDLPISIANPQIFDNPNKHLYI